VRILLLIGTGSFIGGISRYLLSQLIQTKFLSAFPFGTLIVNITGCFVIGLVLAVSQKNNISQGWLLFLTTGICGGFTTFSAFSAETISLLRSGQAALALVYIATSIFLGLLATYIGISLVK